MFAMPSHTCTRRSAGTVSVHMRVCVWMLLIISYQTTLKPYYVFFVRYLTYISRQTCALWYNGVHIFRLNRHTCACVIVCTVYYIMHRVISTRMDKPNRRVRPKRAFQMMANKFALLPDTQRTPNRACAHAHIHINTYTHTHTYTSN